ncbi:hypothetical protein [Salinilacihabitans rarus]|nr:hypothetical protein [Salinilacihabitans rarus]
MSDERRDHEGRRIECEACGASVPAPVYREHLLKACPGERE